jgi:hypothetical protein
MTKKNKQKRCSGKATFHKCSKKGEVLFEDEYVEIVRSQGKNAGEPYTVTKSRVISIRIPDNFEIGTILRIFASKEVVNNELPEHD